MPDLRIATRASRLARTQSRLVADALEAAHPGLTVELVEVTTTGDVDQHSPVAALTEMGAFVRGVQMAVLDGGADLAVHSAKDLPTTGPDGLLPVYPTREAPWDVLCGSTLDDLPDGAVVGTGSPRRAAQLGRLRPDVEVRPIRGNVETRLGLVGNGCDAVVLAEAGLHRLGLDHRFDHRFGLDQMVPAPAQAALCVETTEDHLELVTVLDHAPTREAVEAERLLLSQTGAGCRSALGAHVSRAGDQLVLHGFVEDTDGARTTVVSAGDGQALVDAARGGLGL